MSQLLRLISTNEITMLKDIDNIITINKNGKFKYFHIPTLEIMGISNFISKLEDETFYVFIPAITMFAKDNDPHLILSKQILVSNNSSAKTIFDYLNSQLNKARFDFGAQNLEEGCYFHLILKYKKVTLDFSKLP